MYLKQVLKIICMLSTKYTQCVLLPIQFHCVELSSAT